MKLRVNIAQWEWWYEDYIEIESAGIPRKGDKLILGFKNCRKLEGVILRNYNVAKTYGFLVFKFGDTVSLDISDVDIVHDVDWLADEETGVLECYVHLGDDIEYKHCRFYKYMEKDFTEEDYNKAVERWKERQK